MARMNGDVAMKRDGMDGWDHGGCRQNGRRPAVVSSLGRALAGVALAVAMVAGLGACSEQETAPAECQTSEDCLYPTSCSSLGVCEYLRGEGPGGQAPTGGGGGGGLGSADAGELGDAGNTGPGGTGGALPGGGGGGGAQPSRCTPACTIGQTCVEGQCVGGAGGGTGADAGAGGGQADAGTNTGTVDAGDPGGNNDAGTPDIGGGGTGSTSCMPACAMGQTCQQGQCITSSCAAPGQACDPGTSQPQGFVCAPEDEGAGTCLVRCERPATADSCPSGTYCWAVSEDAQSPAGCYASECQTSSACTDTSNGGTCVRFDNGYGVCLPAGTIAQDASCPLDASSRCAQDLVCMGLDNTTTGVCEATCDPWEGILECRTGEACQVWWPRTGVCTGEIDFTVTGNPRQPFASCTVEGAACGNAQECFDLGTQNVCLRYCRPGQSDCQGVRDGLNRETACYNHLFYGDPSVGICLPACTLDGDCASGERCEERQCRTTCTEATLNLDCCGTASASCGATCRNGLCE